MCIIHLPTKSAGILKTNRRILGGSGRLWVAPGLLEGTLSHYSFFKLLNKLYSHVTKPIINNPLAHTPSGPDCLNRRHTIYPSACQFYMTQRSLSMAQACHFESAIVSHLVLRTGPCVQNVIDMLGMQAPWRYRRVVFLHPLVNR